MKRFAFVFLCLSFIPHVEAQTRTVADKPLHPNPDRVLELVEVLRIPGDGEGYVLEGIRQLDLDEDGCIYTNDGWISSKKSHLLKFSREGRFLKDLLRRGQGPGEIENMFDFAILGRTLALVDFEKRKVVVQTLDGALVRDMAKHETTYSEVYGSSEGKMVLGRTEYPTKREKTGLYDVSHEITLMPIEAGEGKSVATIRNQRFFVSAADGYGAMGWDPFSAVLGEGLLFVNASQSYRIMVIDLIGGRIVREFEKTFRRIPRDLSPGEKAFIAKYHAPKREYENDIEQLLFGDGRLWVKVAAPKEEKRACYDIFDPQGRYLDRFFLYLRGRILKVHGGFLYAEIRDEEDLPVLVKYRIGEPIGAR